MPWARDFPAQARTGRHSHIWAQLVFAASGVMTVAVEDGSWVVPPQRAVWVPQGVIHELTMHGAVALRTLYLAPEAAPPLPRPAVLTVTPLLREIILRLMELSPPIAPESPAGRLVQVLLDEVRALPAAPLHLPRPQDGRARRVAEALLAAPGDGRSLEDWARQAGASPRTLARLFVKETGLGFGAWRQQARLLQSLIWLGEGRAVTSVALDLGYDSPSAFIAAFRRAFGSTPGRYFRTPSTASPTSSAGLGPR